MAEGCVHIQSCDVQQTVYRKQRCMRRMVAHTILEYLPPQCKGRSRFVSSRVNLKSPTHGNNYHYILHHDGHLHTLPV